MRNWLKLIISSIAAISLLAVTSSSYGVAAFARQTGLECNSCHAAPGFPSLNSFGAAFKAAGYTQLGGPIAPVEGDKLSIPGAVNLGVVFKARVSMNVDGTTNTLTTEAQIPDETAVFAGGRVGEDIGYVIELGDAWFNSFKLVFAPEVGPVRIGIVPWLTDAFGAGWVFETLSTGAVRNIRIIEDRNLISAQSATGWGGAAAASGIGLYVWHPMGFLAFTPFIPAVGGTPTVTPAYYLRAAVTPSLDFADLAVGFAYKFGTSDIGTGPVEYNWLAVDAQVMMADLPLTVVISYAANNAVAGFEVSYLNIGVDYLVTEGLGVTVAYRQDLSAAVLQTAKATESQVGGSIKYAVAQNVRLSVDVHYGLATGNLQILPMVSGSW